MNPRLLSISFSRLIRSVVPAVLLSAVGLCAVPAWADEYAEVQRLLNAGQTSDALTRAQQYIDKNPRDPQMRFIKSQALQRANQAEEAEKTLTLLTQDFPELAEPWNNLAVLYAARGELDKAREALEVAVKQNPRYATALENLGDVQIRLALRSYERAREQGGDSGRLSTKADALRALTP